MKGISRKEFLEKAKKYLDTITKEEFLKALEKECKEKK